MAPSHHFRFLRGYMRALWAHRTELTVTFALLSVLVMASAGVMWILEGGQGTFTSFGDVVYWAIITVTTVGYGDVVAVTPAGRAVTAILSLLGAGFLVMTAGILAMSFMEHLRPVMVTCPHCGEEVPARHIRRRW